MKQTSAGGEPTHRGLFAAILKSFTYRENIVKERASLDLCLAKSRIHVELYTRSLGRPPTLRRARPCKICQGRVCVYTCVRV